MRVAITETFEAAHRLTRTPGTCTQIHGHSWKVVLEIYGETDQYGIIVDFRDVKKWFRAYLADNYDHRLLLNEDDRLAELELPGLHLLKEDPTTENLARRIGLWASDHWGEVQVTLHETAHNSAVWP